MAVTVLTLVGIGLFLVGRIGNGGGSKAVAGVATATTEMLASVPTGTFSATPTTSPSITATAASPTPPDVTEVAVATETALPTLATVVPPDATVLVPESALERALKGSVQIIVPAGGSSASTGSGSVITEAGHILTNFHVIGDTSTGRLFNDSGTIFIAISPPELRGDPEIQFMAELVEADQAQDLALLRIVAGAAGEPLPPSLDLSPIPIGNSDDVNIGDDLTVIGFPGLGGATITLTRGSVAGFLSEEGDWIKTDAEINRGNSGGAAIDAAGELIGVPSAAAADTMDLPGKIGLIRPVNLASPLIELARQGTSSEAIE